MTGDPAHEDTREPQGGWKAALHSNLSAAATEGAASAPAPGRAPRGAVDRALGAMATACMVVAGVLLVTLIVIFGWLVWGRYVMNDTPTWVEQAALLIVVWITFLGAAAGVRTGSHLSIDFVREAMPAGPRTVLRWVSALGMLVFGGFMAWQGWGLAANTWGRAIPMLGIQEGWRAVPMAVCGVLTVVFSLSHLVTLAQSADPAER